MWCGECDQLLQGLLFSAVKCLTCDKVFHNNCFSMVKSSEPCDDEDQFEDPEYNLLKKRYDLEWEDFFLADTDEEKAKRLMAPRKEGVFLMISKDAGYELIVKEHGQTNFTAYEVKTANVQGKTLYYLQKGTSAETIVGVIQKQRRALKLYTPFQEQDWDEVARRRRMTLTQMRKKNRLRMSLSTKKRLTSSISGETSLLERLMKS